MFEEFFPAWMCMCVFLLCVLVCSFFFTRETPRDEVDVVSTDDMSRVGVFLCEVHAWFFLLMNYRILYLEVLFLLTSFRIFHQEARTVPYSAFRSHKHVGTGPAVQSVLAEAHTTISAPSFTRQLHARYYLYVRPCLARMYLAKHTHVHTLSFHIFCRYVRVGFALHAYSANSAMPPSAAPSTSFEQTQYSLELWQEMLTDFIAEKSGDEKEQWVVMGNSIGGLLTLMLTEHLQEGRKVRSVRHGGDEGLHEG